MNLPKMIDGKKKIQCSFFLLVSVMINLGYCQSMTGNWILRNKYIDIELNLIQNGNYISGNHCIIYGANGDFIDCAEENQVTLNGNILNGVATLNIESQYQNKVGEIKLTLLSDDILKWELNNNPEGMFFYPESISLYKSAPSIINENNLDYNLFYYATLFGSYNLKSIIDTKGDSTLLNNFFGNTLVSETEIDSDESTILKYSNSDFELIFVKPESSTEFYLRSYRILSSSVNVEVDNQFNVSLSDSPLIFDYRLKSTDNNGKFILYQVSGGDSNKNIIIRYSDVSQTIDEIFYYDFR